MSPAAPGPPLAEVAAPWTLRVADGDDDLALIHRWNTEPHVAAAWHQDWTLDAWRANLAEQRGGDHSLPCLLALDGQDLALLEVYRVARDPLGAHCDARPHDLGIHIALGDRRRTGAGLGRAALRVVAEGLLAADPACDRVLAEPDRANEPSLRAFAAAGFTPGGEIALPDKVALLMIYRRARTTPPAPEDR